MSSYLFSLNLSNSKRPDNPGGMPPIFFQGRFLLSFRVCSVFSYIGRQRAVPLGEMPAIFFFELLQVYVPVCCCISSIGRQRAVPLGEMPPIFLVGFQMKMVL